jgi:putative ABC transport system permease protein
MNVLTNLVKRNLILNKRRTIVTIISIILSCALIGGVATLVGSFQKFMQDATIENTGNYHATFNDVPISKEKYITNNDYIDEVMVSSDLGYAKLEGSINANKPYLFITSFDKNMLENTPINLLSGRLPKNSDEILISSHIEEDGGIKYNLGDNITLDIGNRLIDGEVLDQSNPYIVDTDGTTETFESKYTHTYKVVGFIERPSFEGYSAPGLL